MGTQEYSELTRKKFKVIKLLSQLTGTKRFEFSSEFANGSPSSNVISILPIGDQRQSQSYVIDLSLSDKQIETLIRTEFAKRITNAHSDNYLKVNE